MQNFPTHLGLKPNTQPRLASRTPSPNHMTQSSANQEAGMGLSSRSAFITIQPQMQSHPLMTSPQKLVIDESDSQVGTFETFKDYFY